MGDSPRFPGTRAIGTLYPVLFTPEVIAEAEFVMLQYLNTASDTADRSAVGGIPPLAYPVESQWLLYSAFTWWVLEYCPQQWRLPGGSPDARIVCGVKPGLLDEEKDIVQKLLDGFDTQGFVDTIVSISPNEYTKGIVLIMLARACTFVGPPAGQPVPLVWREWDNPFA